MPLHLRARIAEAHDLDDPTAVARLLHPRTSPGADAAARIGARALSLAARVRAAPRKPWSAEEFLRHHGLSTGEGVALMCIAEALLRIPDPATADALLRTLRGFKNRIHYRGE